MKKSLRVYFAIIALLFQAACQPPSPVVLTPSPLSAGEQALTPAFTSTIAPTHPNTDTTQILTVEPRNTALPSTPLPQPIEFTLCSPLQHETLLTISEIIGDPYNPPPPGRDERHHGVDLSYYHHAGRDTIEGEGVQAILPGEVVALIADRLPYGNMVILETSAEMLPAKLSSYLGIQAGESLYHLYAHMQAMPLVVFGEQVECAHPLGSVGMTGYNIANPHLHLETRIGPAGARFSGMAYYTTSASLEEMENYERWRTSGEFRHFDPMRLFAWYLQD